MSVKETECNVLRAKIIGQTHDATEFYRDFYPFHSQFFHFSPLSGIYLVSCDLVVIFSLF